MNLRHFLCLLILISGHSIQAKEAFKGATLDLNYWDHKSQMMLSGEVYKFPGTLIDPNTFTPEKLAEAELVNVPDGDPNMFGGTKPEGKEAREVSYVIRMKKDPKDDSGALLHGWLSWATKVYLWEEGRKPQMFLSVGDIGKASEDTVIPAFDRLKYAKIPAYEKEAYLIIQGASKLYDSKHAFKAAIYEPFVFGDAHSLEYERQMYSYQRYLVIGLYVLLIINSFSIFLQRREDKGSLLLSLVGLGILLRYLSTENVFAYIFPNPSELAFRLNVFGLVYGQNVMVGLGILFFQFTFPGLVPKWLRIVGILLVAITGPLVLVLSPVDYLVTFVTNMPFVLILAGGLVYVCFKAWKTKQESAGLALTAVLIVVVAHLFDGAIQALRLGNFYVGHYGWAAFLFFQSLITGQRFARTYQRTKQLGAELQIKNDELIGQKKQIERLNDELKEYNEHLEEKVEEKTRDIRSILTNIQQGILAIETPEGEVAQEHSSFLEELVSTKEISGKNIIELCFQKTDLGQDKLDQLKNAIFATVGEDELAFVANGQAFPREYSLLDSQGEKVFEVDWNPVLDQDVIKKLLVVIRDVTELRALQLEAQKQQKEFALIAEIINVPIDKFQSVVESSKRLLTGNLEILEKNPTPDGPAVDILFRNMHTFKGVARSYKLISLTDKIHLAEEKYKDMKAGEVFPSEELILDVKELFELLDTIQDLNDNKLGRKSALSADTIVINKDQLTQNLGDLASIKMDSLESDDRNRIESLRQVFRQIVYTPLERILRPQINGLSDIAQSLGKLPPEVIVDDEGISINPSHHELITNVFSHLLRNSIDHGLETPEVRKAKSKPERGRLYLKTRIVHEQLVISYKDDGAGLNLPKILEKAKKSSLSSANKEDLKAIDVANMIMEAGFSTADSVSDISGRGVGMDAVRAYVEESNGVFELSLEDPYKTTIEPSPVEFLISLPIGSYERML